MHTIAVAADGLSLPGLQSLKRLYHEVTGLVVFVDYPHLLKTMLGVLRLLRNLSIDGRFFSLFVIINAKLAGNGFKHLTMEEHINPKDKMRVQPVLTLIGEQTQHDLRALGTQEALDLETFLALCERYYYLWDHKRTMATQSNPHRLPVMSLAQRLDEIKEVTKALLEVRRPCASSFNLTQLHSVPFNESMGLIVYHCPYQLSSVWANDGSKSQITQAQS
jgi:hypothetical protein